MIYDSETVVDNSAAPSRFAEVAYGPDPRLADLDREILRIAGLSNAIDYKFIKLLAEFDELQGWVGDGIKSFAHWLNWRCGMGALVAREKIRVARKLRNLPMIDAAFRNGELGYTKVRAITRVANEENEVYLIAIAKHGTARHIEKAVQRFNWCKRRDAQESDELDEYRRTPRLNWRQDEFGMYCINAILPPEEGELVIKALHKMTQEMRRDADEKPDAATEKTGESAAGNVNNDENVSRETFSGETSEDRLSVGTYSVNDATALANIAEHYLASEAGPKALASADRYQVLLHVNENAAHIDHKIEQGPCTHIDGGRFLAPEVAQRLACAATVTTILEDDDGNILNIGRRSRTPSRAISLAVQIRDGGCRFPNCHQTRWTDQHHIVRWADGGETSEANLITLCRHHHTLLHQGRFSIEKDGAKVRFIDQFGKAVIRALYPQFPHNPQPDDAVRQFDAECRDQGIHIECATADCLWQGETMDYDMFIEAMYDLEKET